MTSPALGTIYLPSGAGTPVGRFEFLVDPDEGTTIEIGTLITADTDEGPVVGVVSDMRTVGTDQDPVSAEVSRRPDARLGYLPAVRCATVQVLSSRHLRPVGSGTVRAATVDEVSAATGKDKMDWPIPIGTIALADGTLSPVHVDGAFLLGPEAQGLGVFGRSGVASKTSFTSVAVRSAIEHGNDHDHRTAVLVISVKGEDLLWLDKQPAPGYELTDRDLDMYTAMGVPATPFDDVSVYGIGVLGTGAVNSPVADASIIEWDLKMVWPYIAMFLPNVYADEKLSGFIAQFEDTLLHRGPAGQRIDTFEKLDAWFRDQIDTAAEEKSDYIWNGQVHVATARRLRRIFSGLMARGQGLFCRGKAKASDDIPTEGWRHGQVRIMDLAGLAPEVQGFAIARTVDRLMRSAEDGKLGVDHLLIQVDELNQWAPAGSAGEFDRVRKSLQRVATQGRYAGLSLFGSAQAASKIDDLLRDNSATRAVGSSAEAELTSGVHGRLPSGVIERIATLPKGQMLVWHTAFRQPLVVSFPRPAWKMGKSKTTGGQRQSVESVLREHLGEQQYDKAVDRLGEDTLIAVASEAGGLEEAVREIGRAHNDAPRVVHEVRDVDPNNPFGLD